MPPKAAPSWKHGMKCRSSFPSQFCTFTASLTPKYWPPAKSHQPGGPPPGARILRGREFSSGPVWHTPDGPPWNCAPNSPSQTAPDNRTSAHAQPTHTDTNAASPPQSPTADTVTGTPSPDPPQAPTPDTETADPPPAIISRLGRQKFWRCSKNCSLPNHRPPRAPVPTNSIAGSTSKPNAPAYAAGPAQTNWLPTPATKPPPKPPAMPDSPT